MIPTVLGLTLPAATAGILARAFWPVPGSRAYPYLLAAGWAVGLTGCGFFLWYPTAGPPGRMAAAAEGAAGVAAALLAWGAVRRPRPTPPAVALGPTERWGRWLWVPFAAAAAVAARHTWTHYQHGPDGGWDAMALWNLRARFLAAGGDCWADGFSPELFHPDYPPLLPAAVARLWVYAGAESAAVPAALGWVMAGLAVGLLASALNALRGGGQGWLAGSVLLLSFPFLLTARLQTADAPLVFYLLASVTLFTFHDRTGRAYAVLPAAAGMMTGFAALTKNEGLMFAAAVPLVRVLARAGGGWRGLGRELGWFAAGAAVPAGLTLVYFKARLAPPNDLVAGLGPDTLGRLLDPARHAQILRKVADTWLDMNTGMLAVLGAYVVLVGRAPAGRGAGAATPALLAAFLAGGYYLVYLTTPHDLTWHLRDSVHRLSAHVWPLALFALFLAVATPDEAAARGRPSEAGDTAVRG